MYIYLFYIFTLFSNFRCLKPPLTLTLNPYKPVTPPLHLPGEYEYVVKVRFLESASIKFLFLFFILLTLLITVKTSGLLG